MLPMNLNLYSTLQKECQPSSGSCRVKFPPRSFYIHSPELNTPSGEQTKTNSSKWTSCHRTTSSPVFIKESLLSHIPSDKAHVLDCLLFLSLIVTVTLCLMLIKETNDTSILIVFLKFLRGYVLSFHLQKKNKDVTSNGFCLIHRKGVFKYSLMCSYTSTHTTAR